MSLSRAIWSSRIRLSTRRLSRAGTFYDNAAVHVEFAEPFCPVMRRMLLEEGRALVESRRGGAQTRGHGEETIPASPRPPVTASPFAIHDRGCYVCMEGPAFSIGRKV